MSLRFAMLALLLSVPATAQVADDGRIDKRVGKLESEMRAVQRKVFPGGDPRFFEPEIRAPVAAPAEPGGNPASAPIADLSARVDALEGQLRSLTGQIEAQQFKLRQLEDAQTRMKGDIEFRLGALEKPTGTAMVPPAEPAQEMARPVSGPVPSKTGAAAIKPSAVAVPAAAGKPIATAIKPATAGAATVDSDWKAGQALIAAKNWPGVETAMTAFIAAWPKSPRIPQAKLNLGRSQAARGQHAPAAKTFLDLYQSAPRTIQAPEGLLGLAAALHGLAKPEQACRVLDELSSVYGATLKPAQQTAAAAQRLKARCAA